MIKLENTSKRFGKLQVLDSVSLTLERGECIALIGPNGCGKTTLIKSVLGMVVIDKGKLFFQGRDISNDYEYRRNIGYMPQIGRYPENMTVGQVIEMIKNIRTSDKSFDEDLLEQFDLRKLFTKRMCTLSGGTTQKVSATLAFLFNPDVLILDEPTAGLDPLASEILKSKITLEKQKGKLIVITSHVLSELDDLVTQLVYMQDGKVVFHKSLETLKVESGEQKISRAIANLLKQKAL